MLLPLDDSFDITDNNNNTSTMTVFIALSSLLGRCESSLGSCDECRLCVKRLPSHDISTQAHVESCRCACVFVRSGWFSWQSPSVWCCRCACVFVQADSADNHRQSDATQQLDQFKYENDKLKIALAQRSLIACSLPSHSAIVPKWLKLYFIARSLHHSFSSTYEGVPSSGVYKYRQGMKNLQLFASTTL